MEEMTSAAVIEKANEDQAAGGAAEKPGNKDSKAFFTLMSITLRKSNVGNAEEEKIESLCKF